MNSEGPEAPPKRSTRLTAIDALRGLVMVLMAIDHSRDFFGDMRMIPDDPNSASLGLFLTRIVTHLCAPTFIFLAGMSAWLYGQKVTRPQLSWFLFSRGLWLVFLEFTVIYFALSLSFQLPWIFIVIAAIGCSMMALSLISWLPTKIVFALGVSICVLHNTLDGIQVADLQSDGFGAVASLWHFVHQPGMLTLELFGFSFPMEVGYPVLPWLGVMLLGFGMAPIVKSPPEIRQRQLARIGFALLATFVILRAVNGYGDPRGWQFIEVADAPSSTQPRQHPMFGGAAATPKGSKTTNQIDWMRTSMSFLRTQKYPPSLLYLLMTLGTSLILLSLFDRMSPEQKLIRWLNVFGRVPLFFYVLHFYWLHFASILTYRVVRGEWLSPFQTVYSGSIPASFGFSSLWQIYLAWAILLLTTYPLCVWYGKLKSSSKSRWWSYL